MFEFELVASSKLKYETKVNLTKLRTFSMNKEVSKFRTLTKIVPVLSGILTILGLASLVEGVFSGVVVWYGFLTDIVGVYTLVRNQLVEWIIMSWYSGEVPIALTDSVVCYGSLVYSAMLGATELEKHHVFHYLSGRHANFFRRQFGAFMYPIAIFILLDNDDGKRTKEEMNEIDNEFGTYFTHLLILIGVFVCLLFINWQILATLS